MNKYQEPRQCHECFWAKFLDDRVKFECHYNAPICVHGSGTGSTEQLWAIVNPDDFCSKFQGKQVEGVAR